MILASLAVPISRLVDPVLVLLAAVLVGLWLSRRRAGSMPLGRWARIGRGAAWAGAGALWLLATPVLALSLSRAAADRPRDIGPELEGTAPERRALVVLGATIYPDEHGTPAMERLSDAATERCISAARIYRTHGFGRVIVSGRHPDLAPDELARGMAELLEALGVPRERIVLETEALDTKQNAIYSARLAREQGAELLVVVTSALHMPRAARHFARAGARVVTAPVRLDPPPPWGDLAGYLPSAQALRRSQRTVHEVLGRLEP